MLLFRVACRTFERLFRGIVFEVLPDELTSQVVGVGDHGSREIPVEVAPAFFAEMVEQLFFAGIQGVQADEDDFVELRQQGTGRRQRFGHAAVNHAGICAFFFRKGAAERMIERQQDIPDFGKLSPACAAVNSVLTGKEAAAERRNRPLLVLFEEFIVGGQFLELPQVDQQFIDFHEILVEIVEVAEQDVAPIDEIVEGLGSGFGRAGHQADVFLIQDIKQAGLLLGLADSGDFGEKFVDGQDVGDEHRLTGRPPQPPLKESPGPPVGKYKAHPVQRTALSKTSGNGFEKDHRWFSVGSCLCTRNHLLRGIYLLKRRASATPPRHQPLAKAVVKASGIAGRSGRSGQSPVDTMPRVAWFQKIYTPAKVISFINSRVFPAV